ncbi:hypothetical protein BS47DRAFT_1363791 [Hydnum rufescens UP504]|uniref:Uncharacterized protein n=1 Tax=Hydnum rufescens UP504 TaxID=1448309 RepID=A0A9P6DRX7_9AGAM|nr:hypothetical protein BS47DRAFT_1363791 [Hydnum rufescens UP504]
MYPNQKSKSSMPPSDTAVLVTDLNPWEDMRKPPTSIGLPPIQEFEPLLGILNKPCDQVHPGLVGSPAFCTGTFRPSYTMQTITFAPHTILSSPQVTTSMRHPTPPFLQNTLPTTIAPQSKTSSHKNCQFSPSFKPKWVDRCDLAECKIWDQARMWEVDLLAETCRDLEDHQKMVLEDQQAIKGDWEQLLQSVQCSAKSVVKTSDSTANQLSQLAGFVKELNQAMDTMVTVPITPSTALRSIVQHLSFIIQEHNIQTSPVCTFSIYRLIAPPLKYLLLTLQQHEHLKIIPKILPPPQELSWFCKLIRSLCSQLTEEELAAAPGLFTDFETERYLLNVTIQDPLTPPLSPTYTPSDTDSLKVEVTLTVEPMGLPILDPEAVHEAPVKSNLS